MNSNLVLGIRKFLLELPSESFITNYDLVIEKANRKLEDYETLFEVGLTDYDVIKMVPCNYTKTSSDFHLNRLTYILQDSPPFHNKTNYQAEIMSKDLNKLIESSKKYYQSMNDFRTKILGETRDANTTEQTQQPPQSTPSETTQNGKDNKTKEEKKDSVEETIKSFTEAKAKISEMEFRKFSLINFQDSIIYEDVAKPQKLRCVNWIVKSVYNQFIKEEEKKGDIQYFEVNTLEGKVYYITSSEKGFYINSSTNVVFSNYPASLPCFSYTLPGVLAQISPLFKENFSKLISQVLNAEATLFSASPSDKFEWLEPFDNPLYYSFRFKGFNYESENNRYTRLNKEWNEEFQAINDLNFNQDPIQNLSKEKLLNEFYRIFKDTAIETFTKEDQKQTYLGSNLDLRHINYLNANKHILELKDFYFSLNCIVQYKGLRVHAQVITPGVIFNSEHLVEYGEAEEGVIKYNEDFHETYKKFCDKLNIRQIKVFDKNEKEYLIYGNPEIKGVRGVDKRRYLFDLNHLFPRDHNYLNEDNSGCLLRPELIREYQMKLISNKINSEYQEEMKKINSEIESAATTSKDPASYMAILEEKIKRKEEIFEKISNDIKPDLVIDTTLFTETKLKFENEHKEKDEKLLINLSNFLKDEILDKFITEISKDDDNTPSDSFTLTETLHKYGINVRYYGQILKKLENNDFPNKKNVSWIRSLILRDLMRRSAKHLYNETVKDLPEYLVKEFSAYFLNVLLSPTNLLKHLEAFDVEYCNGSIVANKSSSNVGTSQGNHNTSVSTNVTSSTATNKKKKNKSKKKKNLNEAETDLNLKLFINDNLTNKNLSVLLEPNSEEITKYFIKPSLFWNKVKEIIQARYNYEFVVSESFENIEHSVNKYGLMRDFCLTVGLQIKAVDYEFYYDNSTKNEFKYDKLPFKPENVINFFPTVKDYFLPSEIHKPLFDQAEAMFKAGNLLEAAEKYKQVVYLCNEIYGPINNFSCIAHKKLGEISYLEGDCMNSILLIQKSIIISEKLYNYDTSFVANSYAELSTYFHMIGQDLQAFKYLIKALEIIYFTYPRNHPDVCNRSFNLAMYYTDLDLIDRAKEVLESTIKTSSHYLDEDNKYTNKDTTIIVNGEKIIEGLKFVNDEVKKKQNLFKNREDSKRILDDLIKKSVNRLFWEDLERPLPKYYVDSNENAYLNNILKKGMKAANLSNAEISNSENKN